MKVLHVITRLVRGGAQRNTLMCAEDQARQGHEVWVVSGTEAGPEGSLWAESQHRGYRLIALPSLVREINPSHDIQALWSLYRLIRRERFDVVHTHTSKAGLLGRAAAQLAATRSVIHTPHGHVFHSYFTPRKEALIKGLERLASGWCDKVVALSQGCLDDHLHYKICPASQMCIIPSGVNLSPYVSCTTPDPAILTLPGPRLGIVARLVEIKGILDLIDAMALVAQQDPHSTLVVAGDGPLRSQVEAKIKSLSLGSRIRLLGEVVNVAPLYRALDLLVLPSHNEGMGRVLVEGMSVGLPVVATRVGGVPDVVISGYNGILVPPRDPVKLAEALLELVSDPERRRAMGSNGQVHAKNFSDNVMFERLNGLYAEVTNLKARQNPRRRLR